MIGRLPAIPTLIVVSAAAIMVALGVWQLGRAEEKQALIAAYSQATGLSDPVAFPVRGTGEDLWFRRSAVECTALRGIDPVAGTARTGQKGWTQRGTCTVEASSAPVLVDLGFSRDLSTPDWNGGRVEGVIAPGPRLVADPPVGGLQPLALPDPADLPNNHLAYAIQWFIFAQTALVIYGFAVRSRLKRKA